MYRRHAVMSAALALGLAACSAATPQPTTPESEFIKGVDISTLQALEDKGIRFYDQGRAQDLLSIVKAHGVNYVRLRVWNTPTESGGYNDKAKLLALAPRIKAAGLNLLVDFHYSDFWADPGKQVKPAAWANLSGPALQQAVYDYTADVLGSLKAVNAYPDMVQIGNEINSGMLLPDGALNRFDTLAGLLKKGVQAVRDTTPTRQKTKVMLHLADGGDNDEFVSFFDQVTTQGIDYDVIGLSYYPYWHGTFQQLKTNMNDLATRYGKQIVVAETAYPHTLENGDVSPGNIAELKETQIAGFPASVESQKLVTQTVLNTVATVDGGRGLGVFYWEPAWLPGVGWRTGEFNGWENQAMFDYGGKALDSLNAFRFTPGSLGAAAPIRVSPVEGVSVVRGTLPTLPTRVNVLYNEGSIKPTTVRWAAVTPEQVAAPGTFVVEGVVTGVAGKASIEITVTDKVAVNLVQNPGFEDDLQHWTVTGTLATKVETNAGNAHGGSKALNYWFGEPYAYRVTQTITGLSNGTYTLRGWASGSGGETKAALFAETTGGTRVSAAVGNTGWNVWKQYAVENIQVTDGQLTIGYEVEAPKEIWGYLDDLELVPSESK